MTEPFEHQELRADSDEREARRASTDEGDPAEVDALVRQAEERADDSGRDRS